MLSDVIFCLVSFILAMVFGCAIDKFNDWREKREMGKDEKK